MKKTLLGDLSAAREILIKNEYTCVLYRGGDEYHSRERGVKPLLDLLTSDKSFRGFCAADKTVGLGAAHLYVLLGVDSVWASVMSKAAKELLIRNGICAICDSEVEYIINRSGDGMCPIESAVRGIECSDEALCVIRETLDLLKSAGKK